MPYGRTAEAAPIRQSAATIKLTTTRAYIVPTANQARAYGTIYPAQREPLAVDRRPQARQSTKRSR
jgi:hypothetical protein